MRQGWFHGDRMLLERPARRARLKSGAAVAAAVAASAFIGVEPKFCCRSILRWGWTAATREWGAPAGGGGTGTGRGSQVREPSGGFVAQVGVPGGGLEPCRPWNAMGNYPRVQL